MSQIATTRRSSLILDLRSTPPTIELEGRSLPLDESRPSVLTRVGVRAFDIVGAGTLLLLATPVIAAVYALTRVTSSGPAIYRSKRVGQGYKRFNAYKFRSMYVGADTILREMLDNDPLARAEYEASYKLKNDPRVTPLGRHLRRLNLDELPQLVNILMGQMSLVGPRPLIGAELREYENVLPTLFRVKPGLTGLWQVSGRNDLSLDQRTMLEVEYVTSRTLGKDLHICFKTAEQMLRPSSNGAY